MRPPRQRGAGPAGRFAAEWVRRGCWRGDTIAAALDRTATEHPHKAAIVDGARRLTFAELRAHAAALAGGLRGLGIGPGDAVAYQLPNWAEAAIVLHALARLGAVAVPILPAYRARETGFILGDAGARAVIVPGHFRDCDHVRLIGDVRAGLPDLAHVVVARAEPAGDVLAFEALAASPPADDAGDAGAIALLVYTSGTTADPKGVLHTHDTLLAEARSLEAVHGFTAADTVLMPSPLTHISGIVHAVLVPAVLGTTAVLMERWDPRSAHDLIDRERVTYMVGAPTFLRDLCVRARGPGSLRLFSCGGAGVAPELIRTAETTLGCVAKRVYGSTEFPTLTTCGPGDPAAARAETDGRVIGAAELRIVDDSGRPCPPEVEGEILARGPECFVGYGDPALDAESFDAEGWFRTGDLGTVDAAGYLRVTGRTKDIIIRKGENISAREVEDLLAGHPDVAEVAVIGLPDPETGERACAVVRAREGAAPGLDALAAYLRAAGLSTRKLPERLDIVREFPRTASGKIHKAALRAAYTRGGDG